VLCQWVKGHVENNVRVEISRKADTHGGGGGQRRAQTWIK
jgi:hypothetical protein